MSASEVTEVKNGVLSVGNVFELIEFRVDRHLPDGRTVRGIYGVNVIKVREVIRMPEINPLSSRREGVAGVFELRGVPIPAINLAQVLGDEEAPVTDKHQVIVTEFSGKRAGFIVGGTHRIRRVAWDKVLPPSGGIDANITGMTLIEDNEFLFILDLEKILNDLEGLTGEASTRIAAMDAQIQQTLGLHPATSAGEFKVATGGGTVLLVDDSRVVLNYANSFLTRAGYNIVEANDGAEALEALKRLHGKGTRIDAIVSDVEMPRMDGISFVKELRASAAFQGIPVILHTSLSSQSIKQTAAQQDVAGMVIKNDWAGLLSTLRSVLANVKPQKLGA
jgi:two-component system chemotaxis response regulator CheV